MPRGLHWNTFVFIPKSGGRATVFRLQQKVRYRSADRGGQMAPLVEDADHDGPFWSHGECHPVDRVAEQ